MAASDVPGDGARSVRIESLPRLDAGERTRVEVPMSALDRRRVRRRLVTPDGAALELALPTGSVLAVGLVLHVDDDRAYVVTAEAEATLVVRPRDLAEAARAGHLIGNLHRDVDVLADGTVVTLYDAPLEARMRAAGLVVACEDRPFSGRAPGEHAH
jgi:urease accessory protein